MSGSTGAVEGTPAARHGEQGLLDRIRTAFEILCFRKAAVDEAVHDAGGFPYALAVVALAGVAVGVGRGLQLPGIVLFALLQLATSLLLAGAIHLGARLALDSEQDFVRFYRAFGLTYLLFWLTGVPIVHALLRWALWAWQIAAAVLVAERAYGLERVRAALVVGIPILGALFLLALLNGLMMLGALVSGTLF